MKVEIGISEKNLDASIKLLTNLLADESLIYTKTRKFHWNVGGESFIELHRLFKEQYVELEENIDLIAERIGKLGGKSIGTFKEFLDHARLKESPDSYPSQKEMLKELLADHQAKIIALRGDIEAISEKNKDAGTADFLTGIMEEHETTSWILRRYLN